MSPDVARLGNAHAQRTGPVVGDKLPPSRRAGNGAHDPNVTNLDRSWNSSVENDLAGRWV